LNESGPISVLLVDDHEMFAQGLARLLEIENDIVVVGTASGAHDAEQAVLHDPPDVVLMDYRLTDGDGAEATAKIKQVSPSTRVVMLTAISDDAVLLAAIEAGCSGFVSKTNAVEEVVAAVRAAYAGEALISPAMLARLLPKLRRSVEPAGAELTTRELEVLALLAEGLANQAIADKLTVSVHTVRNHVQNILTKLKAHSKLEAVSIAVRRGLIDR
jgi:DNA-binding NarL/FixJ family response regulator